MSQYPSWLWLRQPTLVPEPAYPDGTVSQIVVAGAVSRTVIAGAVTLGTPRATVTLDKTAATVVIPR